MGRRWKGVLSFPYHLLRVDFKPYLARWSRPWSVGSTCRGFSYHRVSK